MNDSPGLFSSDGWEAGAGAPMYSTNPATGQAVWQGRSASFAQIQRAIASAAEAQAAWARLSFADRLAIAQRFAERLRQMQPEFADSLTRETGKPRWETKTEVDAMIGKIAISAEAYADRCGEKHFEQGGVRSAMRFRPHGVVAVLGPFNFPGHLPNGHIVPALLAGNAVVFKPSELAPLVGELAVRAWESAGLPCGVLNLVQGGRETGEFLLSDSRLAGVFFTGGVGAGVAISKQFAAMPGKILALEMGGNNPLIAWDVADLAAAAIVIIQSAFITAGQRCSCARRLIVPTGPPGDAIIAALLERLGTVRIGLPDDNPEPFMGPVISAGAADKLLRDQAYLVDFGRGRVLREMLRSERCEALLLPGVVEMPEHGVDAEMFGPLLQVLRAADFSSALQEANRTRFGLCAGLLSDDPQHWRQFQDAIRAGVIYWNRPTTGASSRLPFGGLGDSGNHRPSAYLAADYCSHAIALTESDRVSVPANLPPGLE